MKTFKQFISESSLSRLYSKYKQCDSGTITGYRAENTTQKNKENNAKLKAALVGGGFSVTAINGYTTENYGSADEKRVAEKSFIVFDRNNTGNLKQTLIKLGRYFDQDSITFSDAQTGQYYLIGTSKRENSYPGYNVEKLLGKPMFGQDGEFYSSIRGRPFVFTECAQPFDDTRLNYHSAHNQFYKRVFNQLTNESS